MRERHRIAIIGDDFTPPDQLRLVIEGHPRFLSEQVSFVLADIGDMDFHQDERAGVREFLGNPTSVAEWVTPATIVVTTFAPITADVLSAAPSLELVACGRGGPVNIDIVEATRRGVAVTNCPGRNAQAVAEFVLGALISLVRRIPAAERQVSEQRWVDAREDSFDKPTGPELNGRTLGVIGFGEIGRRVCELVAPLRMRILIHDPFVDRAEISAAGAEPAALVELLTEAEFITLHARPAEDGQPLLGPAEFAHMRPGAFLINTSRGENVDEHALVDSLANGKLAGAALDVYAIEPLPKDHPLRRLDSVLLTPHSAGVSQDVPLHTARMLADCVTAWLHEEHPAYICNPSVLADPAKPGFPA